MPCLNIVRESEIVRTPRLLQMEGIFDIPPSKRSAETWAVNFDLPPQWNVGVIVGPSGSGKTTVAREVFGSAMADTWEWPEKKSLVDGFPASMGIKDITALLSSVGFSSPPSWVRPFHVLSNGEQFRVNMARTLAEMKELAVVDEFTSVVDRTVAQIGSAAIAKTVRKRGQKFVAVACHYDILEWLEPDWVYQPHTNQFELARGRLQRPAIELEIKRVHHSAWKLFRKHHYLDSSLNVAARCFCAFHQGTPVAFSAWLPFPSGTMKNAWREHRTVCLPDFQGVGIGNALSEFVCSVLSGIGKVPVSTTSHPGMIQSRLQSKKWKLNRATGLQLHAGASGVLRPDLGGRALQQKKMRRSVAATRLTAGFRYIGAALPVEQARQAWAG